jgi:homoaconitate hydratase
MALLGVIVKDDKFYELAVEGSTVSLDKRTRTVTVNGSAVFPFELSRMEQGIIYTKFNLNR